MPGFRRVNALVESSQIAAQAVSYDKQKLHIESAVATLPPTAAYKTFTTVFGTPPNIDVNLAGTLARQVAGTPRLSFDVIRVRPGSFQWRGTPSVRARWYAWGERS